MSDAPAGRKPRLFLDANVLVSGVAFRGLERDLLSAGLSGSCQLLTSEYVLTQVRRILEGKLHRGAREVDAIIGVWPIEVVASPSETEIQRAEQVLRDASNAPVLAAAWEAEADALVTGDKDLHALGEGAGMAVVRTREALALIGEQAA